MKSLKLIFLSLFSISFVTGCNKAPSDDINEWPKNHVASFLSKNKIKNDVIPVLEGGTEYIPYIENNKMTITVKFDDETAVEEKLEEYFEYLDDDGNDYINFACDEEENFYLTTEHFELEISPRILNSDICIYITALDRPPLNAVFPTEEVASAITETFGINAEIPDMPNAASYDELIIVAENKIRVTAHYGNYYAAFNALFDYEDALIEARLSPKGGGIYDGDCYANDLLDYEIRPWVVFDSDSLVVDIVSTFYPEEGINLYLKDNGATDKLPIVTRKDGAYEVRFYTMTENLHCDASILTLYHSVDNAEKGKNTYADALLNLGYIEDGVDSDGYAYYLSPNEQFRMRLFHDSSSLHFYADIIFC